MDTARNSYSIVEVLNRSSYACVICLQKLETPPIKLSCGCSILAHPNCLPSTCPDCTKKSWCLSRSHKNDKVLACAIVTILGIVCIAILLLVLKFGYNII